MLKVLRRLVGYSTLISLVLWSALVMWVLSRQPVTAPPPELPRTVAECHGLFAAPMPYAELRTAVGRACDNYYALLGDRGAPFWLRLKEITVQPIVDTMVREYLAAYPPAPGQVVQGNEIFEKIGTRRVLIIAKDVFLHPGALPDRKRLYVLRCSLENTHKARSAEELGTVQMRCMQ